jgi:tetratricopeptide (TPR) repeat protein
MPRSSGSERQSFAPVASSPPNGPADERSRAADGEARAEAESTRDVAHEDFLFHLYRGSELLQENRVVEAKEELEFALTMQPLDAKGQDLLAAVYFRLGLYPRAIQIYEALAGQFDRDVAIKTNLALAYLKTGQPELASRVLKEAVRLNPNHKRAWGYLGLAHQKLGELGQAEMAFERGGHVLMAKRATAKRKSLVPPSPAPATRLDPEVREFAETAFLELDAGELRFALAELEARAPIEGTWHALELGEPDADRRAAGRTLPMPSPFDAMELADDAPLAPDVEGPAAPDVEAPAAPDAEAAIAAHGESEAPVSVRIGSESPDGESDAYAATRLVPPPLTHVPTPTPPNPGRLRGAPPLFGLGSDAAIGLGAAGLLLVRTGAEPARAFAGRLDAIRAIGGAAMTRVLHRRTRDAETAEVLGGIGSPLVRIAGEGELVMGPRRAHELALLTLDDDLAFLREDCVLGFQLALSYENGRVALDPATESGRPSGDGTPIVQLRGTGTFVVEVAAGLTSLASTPGRPLIVRREWIVGWFGRLVTRALPAAGSPTGQRGLVSFAGEGLVLLCYG